MGKKLNTTAENFDGSWEFLEAKAKLSQLMDQVEEIGMQVIIRNCSDVYMVLSKEKYDALILPKTSLLEFFLNAPYPELDLDIRRNPELPRELSA